MAFTHPRTVHGLAGVLCPLGMPLAARSSRTQFWHTSSRLHEMHQELLSSTPIRLQLPGKGVIFESPSSQVIR